MSTGLPNKDCPRVRDSAFWRSGEITQPRTSLIRELCILWCLVMEILRWNEGKERAMSNEPERANEAVAVTLLRMHFRCALVRPSRLRSERAFHILSAEGKKCLLGLVKHMFTPS